MQLLPHLVSHRIIMADNDKPDIEVLVAPIAGASGAQSGPGSVGALVSVDDTTNKNSKSSPQGAGPQQGMVISKTIIYILIMSATMIVICLGMGITIYVLGGEGGGGSTNTTNDSTGLGLTRPSLEPECYPPYADLKDPVEVGKKCIKCYPYAMDCDILCCDRHYMNETLPDHKACVGQCKH